MSETTKYFKTSGLHCASCSKLVDMTVGELEGVADVSTDLASAETVVRFDPDIVTENEIILAIRGAGYDAELVD
ncbi:MAG: heavy-metal-associated domain-containing protein [Coriobacteriia bacterium]|nr:heavy-metal-associated domain-containing protein [Coriobacteriia bacterium]